jgi:hypothetical protein
MVDKVDSEIWGTNLVRKGKTTGGEPLKYTNLRDFSSKGNRIEAFLLA